MEESCCSRMLPFADLLCIFRISPDIYFLPTLAGCFWCFLLVHKLNMIGSYPNERDCLSKISFKIRTDLRLWIQSNKLSKLARFPCCKWVRDYSLTWATDESSNLIINPAIFLSGLGEVDFAVASVAVKKCLRQTSKRGAYKVYSLHRLRSLFYWKVCKLSWGGRCC